MSVDNTLNFNHILKFRNCLETIVVKSICQMTMFPQSDHTHTPVLILSTTKDSVDEIWSIFLLKCLYIDPIMEWTSLGNEE